MSHNLRDERGASLLMVTIFVLVFGIITAAVLDLATTGFKTNETVREISDHQLIADGATDGAINGIRGSNNVGAEGFDCPNFDYDPGGSEPFISVVCTPLNPGTTNSGGVNAPKPKYTVLTLGTDQCEGLVQEGNHELSVTGGGIFSNGRIAVGSKDQNPSCASFVDGSKAFLRVFGDVSALRTCTPASPIRMAQIGDPNCDFLNASPPGSAEAVPAYPTAAPGIGSMAVDPPASCGGNSLQIVKFLPGVYSQNPRNHVPTGCGAGNAVWWFSPGVYYFDFPEATSLWELWASTDTADTAKNVIGGTLGKGHNGIQLTESSLASQVVMPGACDSGTEAAPNPGVQFILGGTTRLFTKSDNGPPHRGDLEICAGKWAGTNQRIVLYGLHSNSHVRTTVGPENRLATPPAASTGFSPSDGAITPEDGSVATATMEGGGTTSASLQVANFADVPAGAEILSAKLRIRHRSYGSHPEKANLALTWKATSGGADQACPISWNASLDWDECDISSAINAAPFPYKSFNDVFSAALAVSASSLEPQSAGTTCDPSNPDCVPSEPTPAQTTSVDIDAILLDVTYRPIGFDKHRCPTSRPNCALFETVEHEATGTRNAENPMTFFQGTVFAPNARLSIYVHNGGRTAFRRGVIARTIRVNVSASTTQDDAPFQLPEITGAPDGRLVLFEAYQCPGRSACTPADATRLRLRARVRYIASDTDPGAQVRVEAWKMNP